MSFDVYVADEWVGNYTANMGAFFAWALDGTEQANPTARSDSRDALLGQAPVDGLKTLDGLTAKAAADRLGPALARIVQASKSELQATYDAPNGWGSIETATMFLWKLCEACRMAAPDAPVLVSW